MDIASTFCVYVTIHCFVNAGIVQFRRQLVEHGGYGCDVALVTLAVNASGHLFIAVR